MRRVELHADFAAALGRAIDEAMTSRTHRRTHPWQNADAGEREVHGGEVVCRTGGKFVYGEGDAEVCRVIRYNRAP